MVIIEIYEHPINVKYKTTLISKTSLIVLVCSLVSIVLPFILAYRSEGFWLKHDTFYEQPTVKFKGDYLLVATTNNSSKTVICSNLNYYRQYLNLFDECSIIKAREEDFNNDNIIDSIFFSFKLYLGQKVHLSSINMVLPILYELKSTCLFEMESAIIYQQYVQNLRASEMTIYADLQLHQIEAIRCSKLYKNLSYNESVIPENRHFEGYYLDNILEKYAKRPVKTTLNGIFTTLQAKKHDSYIINLTIRYPKMGIYYIPNLFQIIKMAWIQYFAIYVLVGWVMYKIKGLVFRKNWVVFYRVDPLKLNK